MLEGWDRPSAVQVASDSPGQSDAAGLSCVSGPKDNSIIARNRDILYRCDGIYI